MVNTLNKLKHKLDLPNDAKVFQRSIELLNFYANLPENTHLSVVELDENTQEISNIRKVTI